MLLRRNHTRRGRRPLLTLGLVALVAAVGANGAARADTGADELAAQFGGYRLASHGNGMLVAFDAVGFVPGNPRVLQQGLPEAQATGASGPTNYALASLDYPGSVLGDLGAIAAQTGAGDNAKYIPSYPVQARAYFPGDPSTVHQDLGGAAMDAVAAATTSDGTATYSGEDLPGFLHSTGITVHANTHLEEGRAVSQLRAEMSNVDFAGLIHFDSIVTDIRADSDGTAGGSSGTTTVSGMTVLGLPAFVDSTGVHLAQPTPEGVTTTTQRPGVLSPILPQVVGQVPLTGLTDQLQGVANGLSQLITLTVGSAGTIDDLLTQAGITVKLLEPTGNDDGSASNRTANGLLIQANYNPSTQATLEQLFALLPTSSLPSTPLIPGLPVNTSPQGLVSLLQQVYALSISLVPGAVESEASPPFGATSVAARSGGSTAASTAPKAAAPVSPSGASFNAPAPSLGSRPTPSGTTLADAVPVSFIGDAVPAWAVLLVLLSLPLWAVGSSRLADNTLTPTAGGSSCPDALEGTHPGGTS